jgi:hypothetical protein
MLATNFDEYTRKVGEETPHGLVLAEYRRLELAIREYLAAHGIAYVNGLTAQKVIAADRKLGNSIAKELASLRRIRNEVAHGTIPMTPAEAEEFAQRAFALLGRVGLALHEMERQKGASHR